MIIGDVVQRAVRTLAPNPTADVRQTSRLVADLGYDSIRLVELSFLLEELFGLDSAAMDAAPPIQSVADLQEYAQQLVAEGRATVPEPETVDALLSSA